MKNSLLNLSDPFFTTRFLGFDNLFDSLRTFSEIGEDSRSYPPYNIRREGNEITIEVAVAGLSEDDLKVETKENNLSIAHEGSKNDSGEVLHQGIAARAFKLQFSLAPEVVVKSAKWLYSFWTDFKLCDVIHVYLLINPIFPLNDLMFLDVNKIM